jgi:hypothetical protein
MLTQRTANLLTNEKENEIFLIYKEIKKGIGCKVISEEGLPTI